MLVQVRLLAERINPRPPPTLCKSRRNIANASQKSKGISIEIFSSQWLRTLYSYNFPLEIVFRIWDVFFVEGMDFLIWVGLILLDSCKGMYQHLFFSQSFNVFSLTYLFCRATSAPGPNADHGILQIFARKLLCCSPPAPQCSQSFA